MLIFHALLNFLNLDLHQWSITTLEPCNIRAIHSTLNQKVNYMSLEIFRVNKTVGRTHFCWNMDFVVKCEWAPRHIHTYLACSAGRGFYAGT